MKALGIFALALSAGLSAQTEAKKADACAPPPGSTLPSLPAKLLEGQGTVHFPITTKNPEAQKFFTQGVAQMHSFWAREALRSFLQAAELDPEAPMPHWGIAMVHAGDWRPKFQLDGDNRRQPAKSRGLEAARKAAELAAVPGKATDLEKMYIAAVLERRNPKYKDPDEAFVKALRELLAKYPNETEAKSYLSLMLMRGFTLPEKQPKLPSSTEAVAILRELLEKAPDHPGVHHYVIHAWEGSNFAQDAWPSCKRYSELVTNIPHALHMPGHIYSQTGKWDDAIRSFEDAAKNETGYMKADKLYGNQHHGHNMHYLATAYSFRGEHENAVKAARGLLAMPETPREQKQLDHVRTAYMQGWFALMRTLVQFGKWDQILSAEVLSVPVKPRQKAWYHWARGVALSAKNDAAAAQREAAAMKLAMAEHKRVAKGDRRPELEVGAMELKGQIEIAKGKPAKGLKILERASIMDRHLRYNEPPLYPRPVAEALGQHALKLGNTAVAEAAFRTALEQFPADYHAQVGLRALGKTGSDAGL